MGWDLNPTNHCFREKGSNERSVYTILEAMFIRAKRSVTKFSAIVNLKIAPAQLCAVRMKVED